MHARLSKRYEKADALTVSADYVVLEKCRRVAVSLSHALRIMSFVFERPTKQQNLSTTLFITTILSETVE